MNPAMIRAEVRKITHRRGLFITSLVMPALAVLLVTVISVIDQQRNPDTYSNGRELMNAGGAFAGFVTLVMAALIGATAGAWDLQNGTFRYMAMTGRSRLSLYLARVPALMVVVAFIIIPAGVLNVVVTAVLPHGQAAGPSVTDHLNAFWTPLLEGWVYGLVSVAVGALLRSVGGAIAVALVLNLAGLNLLLLIGLVNDTLADLVLPSGVNRLVGFGDTPSVPVAIAVVVVWLAAFVGAGAVRTIRSEY